MERGSQGLSDDLLRFYIIGNIALKIVSTI